MDKLIKKLNEMRDLTMPELSKPTIPEAPSVESTASTKAPKAKQQQSAKDPVKAAEQLKNPDMKNQAVKDAKKLKEVVKFDKSGQWYIDTESELEKSIKKKLGTLALAGSAALGGSGEAKGDIGHLKSYLQSLHGMEIGDQKLKVSHTDHTKPELKGTTIGSGKFRINVGDFNIDGEYSGAGTNYSKLKLTKPYHHKKGHAPFDSDNSIDDKGDLEIDSLHNFLSGSDPDSANTSLHHQLQRERKPGDKRGLNIGNFNTKAQAAEKKKLK